MLVATSPLEYDELLSRCALFNGLGPVQLMRVSVLLSERVVQPGAVIVREGDPAQ